MFAVVEGGVFAAVEGGMFAAAAGGMLRLGCRPVFEFYYAGLPAGRVWVPLP